MVRNFASDQGLSQETEASLTSAMQQEHEQIMQLFRDAREDGSWRAARAASETVRSDTDEQMAEVLDEEQLEAWQQLREEENPRRGR